MNSIVEAQNDFARVCPWACIYRNAEGVLTKDHFAVFENHVLRGLPVPPVQPMTLWSSIPGFVRWFEHIRLGDYKSEPIRKSTIRYSSDRVLHRGKWVHVPSLLERAGVINFAPKNDSAFDGSSYTKNVV